LSRRSERKRRKELRGASPPPKIIRMLVEKAALAHDFLDELPGGAYPDSITADLGAALQPWVGEVACPTCPCCYLPKTAGVAAGRYCQGCKQQVCNACYADHQEGRGCPGDAVEPVPLGDHSCDACEKIVKTRYYCPDCQGLFCVDCQRTHFLTVHKTALTEPQAAVVL
jgi:hypothetical protein